MTRVDASLPEPLAELLDAAVDDGLFKGPSDAARVATRAYFAGKTEARLEAVQALLEAQVGENDIELTDVVRLTGRLPQELPAEIRSHYEIPGDPEQPTNASSEGNE